MKTAVPDPVILIRHNATRFRNDNPATSGSGTPPQENAPELAGFVYNRSVTDQLLQTKLALPPLRPFLVHRRHLLETFHQSVTAVNGRLTLITAPAGFGKTTLVAHALSLLPHRTAWLSLETADNDPARFLAYLMAALRTLCAPHTDAPPPAQMGLPAAQAALTPLLNHLQQAASPAILVLDDYHLITNARNHDLIAFLLAQMPPALHLVLTTREEPPLPLALLQVRGQMVAIRAAQLRFSPAETAVFYHHFLQMTVPAATLDAITQQTQGWVAGLQLAGLALQADPAAPLPAVAELATDYLLEEVLRQQPPAIQQFLLATAVPDRLCAGLAAALLPAFASEIATPAEMLTQVVARNLFLTPLRDGWFQYHPIFHQFLRQQVAADGRQAQALHLRAGNWLATHGWQETAVDHYLDGHHFAAAAQLLAEIVPAAMQRGEIGTIDRWLARLPEALVRAQPSLALARLWLFISTGQPQAIMAQADTLADAPPPAQAAETYALLALAAAMADQPQQALAFAQQAEAQAAANSPAQAYVAFALAAAYKTSRAFPEAAAAFLRAEQIATAMGLPNIQFSAVANLGDMQQELGQLHAANLTSRRALALPWPDKAAHPFTGWIHWSLGRIAYEWNDLAAAADHADRSVPLCLAWGHAAMAVRGQLLRAQIAQAQQDWAAAAALLDEAVAWAQQSEDGRFPAAIVYQRLLLALRQGDLHAARHQLQVLAAQPAAPATTRHLGAARVALADGMAETAVFHLEATMTLFREAHLVPRLVQTLVLLAVAHGRRGDRAAQALVWREALALAEPGELVRTFVDEGSAVRGLLAGETAVTPYIARLLGAFVQVAETAVSLTPREQEVLRLMAAGLANRAIAAQLVISESTAKRHISNIYLKLGVHSRAEATSRAAEWGLL